MDHVETDRLADAFAAPRASRVILTRRERLERWAALVEKGADDAPSAIDIAYRDPVLRSQGLAAADPAEAAIFFGIEPAAARALTRPAPPGSADARLIARRLRKIAARRDRTLVAAGLAAASVVSVPLLAYFFA